MRPRWPGALAAAGLLATVLLCRLTALDVLGVSSDSMEPTLRRGDRVLVRTVLLREVHRDDLVTFVSPEDDRLALKRVIGVPGDRVAIADGVLTVNDRPVRQPYADPEADDARYWGPVRVPAGRLVVMGDNRETSIDSRAYGFVAMSRLRGVVLMRVARGERTPAP